MQTNQEQQFREQWPACLDAMEALYGKRMPLPDHRYEATREQLQRLRQRPEANEIEKAVRQLFDFDGRFCGLLMGYDYEWTVYSLCYLCKDEAFIKDLLNIYVPLLGGYMQESLGRSFHLMTGSTFMDDVGHVLWDVEGLIEFEDHDLFDWHGNRNDLSNKQIEAWLRLADLPPLPNPSFPPRRILLQFTDLLDHFDSEDEYLRDLKNFYDERGYTIE
ncbi:hypothetical protein [Vreelandella massiliensis]|uniref:hypothetical protein n=1 Tax=Vreelandella massiliensis TaxID=1816686 RepID=UPI00096A94E1|nr:hypothetical protein [Halomonas massiliensis]